KPGRFAPGDETGRHARSLPVARARPVSNPDARSRPKPCRWTTDDRGGRVRSGRDLRVLEVLVELFIEFLRRRIAVVDHELAPLQPPITHDRVGVEGALQGGVQDQQFRADMYHLHRGDPPAGFPGYVQ